MNYVHTTALIYTFSNIPTAYYPNNLVYNVLIKQFKSKLSVMQAVANPSKAIKHLW